MPDADYNEAEIQRFKILFQQKTLVKTSNICWKKNLKMIDRWQWLRNDSRGSGDASWEVFFSSAKW